ncbi:MAG: hypothetical protein ACK5JD_13330 [Mangrovibacterium sp.]
MKYIGVMIILLSSINLVGQVRSFMDIQKDILEQMYKMGVDDSPLLNSYESAYFNEIFKENLNGFDFTGKKIGFIYSGSRSNKKEYFDLEKTRFNRDNTPNRGTLYIFVDTQKEESGGYDAAIVYWSKRLIPIQDVIKRLR